MTDELKQLIQKSKDMIDNNFFAALYQIFPMDTKPEVIGEFTQTMLSVGIDPIKDGKLTYMPPYYLSCTDIETFEIPKTITKLGEGCFAYCEKLINLTIPENIERIGPYAFAECSLDEIYIPSTVKTIDQNAFFGSVLTVICEKESAADKYCQFYDIDVRYI